MSRKDIFARSNPFYCAPKNPNYLRRSRSHDYTRPSWYMLTLRKADGMPWLSSVLGDCAVSNPANANYPSVRVSELGKCIELALVDWEDMFSQIAVKKYVIMPDHVHICVHVKSILKVGLSRAVSRFMGRVSRRYHDLLYHAEAQNTKVLSYQAAERHGNEVRSVFSKGFNDRIAYTPEQWDRQLIYIGDNPRRLLMKRDNPDIFLKNWIITVGERCFKARGNIYLLKYPELLVVRWSSKYSDAQWTNHKLQCDRCIENCGVMISPFIHPNEKAIKAKAMHEGSGVIRICENGFSEKFQPWREEFDYMGTRQLLLIAPMYHNSQHVPLSRSTAMAMNGLAEEIASIDWTLPHLIRPE